MVNESIQRNLEAKRLAAAGFDGKSSELKRIDLLWLSNVAEAGQK